MLRYLCFARWKLVHIGTFSARFNWKKHAEARVFLTMRHQDLSCAGWEPPSKEQTWRKNALAQKFGTFSVEASFSYSYLDSLSACSSIAIFLFWRNWMPNAYGKLEKQNPHIIFLRLWRCFSVGRCRRKQECRVELDQVCFRGVVFESLCRRIMFPSCGASWHRDLLARCSSQAPPNPDPQRTRARTRCTCFENCRTNFTTAVQYPRQSRQQCP
jgi:hypothetical protein